MVRVRVRVGVREHPHQHPSRHLELVPSDLELALSQKMIDLRLAPLHKVRVRI